MSVYDTKSKIEIWDSDLKTRRDIWRIWDPQILNVSGEAVCRPISGSLIAEAFDPSARGLANGIFSWGVYYGYGLAYVVGIYLTQVSF